MGEETSTDAPAQLTHPLDVGPISVMAGLSPAGVETGPFSRFRDRNGQGGSGGRKRQRKRQSKDGGVRQEGCGSH